MATVDGVDLRGEATTGYVDVAGQGGPWKVGKGHQSFDLLF